jgi:hypothetical protein
MPMQAPGGDVKGSEIQVLPQRRRGLFSPSTMTRFKKLVPIPVGYLVAFAVAGAALGACLLDDYSVKAEYVRSFAVVRARVISERQVPDPEAPEFIGGTIYPVRIQKSFRGTLHGTVEVFSENSSGRFPMEKGKPYLLFLYRAQGRLSADPCGNSGLVAQKRDVLAVVRALSKQDQIKPKRTSRANRRGAGPKPALATQAIGLPAKPARAASKASSGDGCGREFGFRYGADARLTM